jgi:hypothetical protein
MLPFRGSIRSCSGGATEEVLSFLLKKRKNKIPTPINKTMLRASKPLFMQIFWQVNQSLQGKYSHSGHFRKQLTDRGLMD